MNVLIVEDDEEKAVEIRNLIEAACAAKGAASITVEDNINGAIFALGKVEFDLIVADLVLPQMHGALDTQDATDQWCELIESAVHGQATPWIVMTSYSEIAIEARVSFARHGVAVIEYDENEGWKRILRNRVIERFVNPPSDFIIVCALEKEREGLRRCGDVVFGEAFTAASLDCIKISLGELNGVAIKLPRAGLIAAAITTTKAANIFRPKAIAMSGICAGIVGESKLGDLVVPDLSWNYQAGKLKEGKFQPEMVQVQMPPDTSAKLSQMATAETLGKLREGLLNTELANCAIHLQAMVSGSMVVADGAAVGNIAGQSRKVAGLDMEVASVYAAAHNWFNGGGIYFAAKTVVDLADGHKDDRYHEYGCVLSARFTVDALKTLLN